MKSSNRVVKNSIFNLSSTFLTKVGGLIFTVILARLLSPDLLGVYFLALSVGLIFLTFTDLGINGALVRYAADAIGKKDEKLARSYFRYLLKIKVLFTLLTSLVLLVGAEIISINIFNNAELILPIQLVSIFIFLNSLEGFLRNGFSAMQNFKDPIGRDTLFEISRIIIVPIFIVSGFFVAGVFVGLALSSLIGLIFLFYYLQKKYRFFISGSMKGIGKRRLFHFISFTSISLISLTVFGYIDTIIAGIFLPTADVGFYRAGYSLVLFVASLTTISVVLFPMFTQMGKEKLLSAFQKVFKYISIIAFPLSFGLAWFSAPFIKIIYGPEYLPATLPLSILSLLIIESSLGSLYPSLFAAKERPDYSAKVTVVSVTINIVLNVLFVMNFGIVGIAMASVISKYFNSIVMGLLMKKVMKIYPKSSSIFRPLLASLIMMGLVVALPYPSTILIGMLEIALAGGFYFTILYLIRGYDKSDVLYVKNAIFSR